MFWSKLFLALLAVFLIWWLWRTYRNHPEIFSSANLSKSFFTMGILALILIGFVAICVMWLRLS